METTTQTKPDNATREDVLRELEWDPKISSASDIALAVKDGVVTLSGFVPTFWDKDAAEKAAKRVYGVKAVANDISVKPLWQRTDPEIARDAIQQLERHISIPDDRIKATVKNGWVTLVCRSKPSERFRAVCSSLSRTSFHQITAVSL